jgi:plasmid stabilization system protein ParE
VTFAASFNSLAEAELSDAVDYYEQESPGLGAAFLAAVEHAVTDLVEYPESAPVLSGPYRKKVLSRFPFNLIYRLKGNEIRILAIAHQRRRPYYWLGRT